jgi:hypothetical protein
LLTRNKAGPQKAQGTSLACNVRFGLWSCQTAVPRQDNYCLQLFSARIVRTHFPSARRSYPGAQQRCGPLQEE